MGWATSVAELISGATGVASVQRKNNTADKQGVVGGID